jgi:cytidine deaminase
MSEYVKEDFLVYAYDEEKDEIYEYKITELLPESFNL